MKQEVDLQKYLNDSGFISYLEGLMPASKMEKIAHVLPFRTRHVVTVIENVLDSNNTNAILRTSEALGIHEAHLVYGNIKYIPQKSVSKGAHLWMDTFKYGEEHQHNALACIQVLKHRGYQLVVTSPNAKNTLDDIQIEQPLAVCFGQESKGISDTFLANAAITISIPQFGFTDSYNVAVAAGMVLMPIMEKLRKSNVLWQLKEEEKSLIIKKWLFHHFDFIDAHYRHYIKQK